MKNHKSKMDITSSLVSTFQGINFLVPILDKIRYVQTLKEMVIDIEQQQAITKGQPS